MPEPTSHIDVPQCDNPSGLYCKACRAVRMSHCHDPMHCGGMQPMRAWEHDHTQHRALRKRGAPNG